MGTLLGETVKLSPDKNIVAEKLEQLNVLLAERNRRNRRIWRAIATTLALILVIMVLSFTLLMTVGTVADDYYNLPATSVNSIEKTHKKTH